MNRTSDFGLLVNVASRKAHKLDSKECFSTCYLSMLGPNLAYGGLDQWLLAYYSTQVLLLIFMLVISLLLLGFFGYHLNLVIYNTTTNEACPFSFLLLH